MDADAAMGTGAVPELAAAAIDESGTLGHSEISEVKHGSSTGCQGGRGDDGGGIGLAIAQRALRLHGGTIRAFNRDAGGLRVEISLPTGRAIAL